MMLSRNIIKNKCRRSSRLERRRSINVEDFKDFVSGDNNE